MSKSEHFELNSDKDLNKPQNEGVVLRLEEKQRKIHEALRKLSPKSGARIAAIYEGIIFTARNKYHPDRIAQASHSIRELANIIPRFKTGLPERSQELNELVRDQKGWDDLFDWVENPFEAIPSTAKKIIDKVKRLLKQPSASEKITKGLIDTHPNRANLPSYLQDELVKEWMRLHEWFVAVAHYSDLKKDRDPISEVEFEENIALFEDIFYRVLCVTPFFESIDEIDKLLKIEKPTSADIATLSRLISHANHRQYFFKRCNNPEWLGLLKEKGAFKDPQEPLRKDDYVQFIPWPESAYLAKMAVHKPEEVFNIIKNLRTENQTILSDFMDAGLNSSTEVAALYVDLIVKNKWIQSPYNFIIPDKVGDLIEKLAGGERIDEALKLVHVIFETKIDKPTKISDDPSDSFQYIHHDAKTFFDDWRLGEIAKEKLKELAAKNANGLFGVIASSLHQAIRLEKRVDEDDPLKDYAHIWRPNIWAPRRNREDAKNIMIDSLMALVEENKSDHIKLREFLEILKKHKFAIFRRIEMAIYALNPSFFKSEIEAILTDRSMMERSNMRKEYLPLLNKAYGILTSEAQELIRQSIEQGFDTQKPDSMSEEDFNKAQSEWKALYRGEIKDHLPVEEVRVYEDYVAKYGKPSNDDGELSGWVGGGSPIGVKNLTDLGLNGVIEYLLNYKGSNDPFDQYSSNGLGMTFSEVVKENFGEYAKIAPILLEKKVKPIYVYHFLNGLRDAFNQGNCFSWGPVIDMCFQAVHKSKKEMAKEKSDREQDWESVRRAISDFLNGALRTNACTVPFELKEKVWGIISVLAEDLDPTPGREATDGGGNLDPLSLAINSIRGETMHAAINYGLWRARQAIPNEDDNKMPAELKILLERHLDISHDPSCAIRSVYGWRLPNMYYLSKKWLEKNKSKIFSQESRDHFLAAWAGYLTNGVIEEVFDLLKEEYRSFIPILETIEKTGYQSLDIDQKFPQHLMIAYCHNAKHDDLISDFFKQASGRPRGEAINFCGRVVLREIEGMPNKEDIRGRLAVLWDARLNNPPKVMIADEFRSFGWWFKYSPLSRKETLERMIKTLELSEGKIDAPYEIVEELVHCTGEFPLKSIKILDLIARAQKETYEISYKRDEYRKIIKEVKASEVHEAIEVANELVNYFGEQGFIDDFRDLL